MKYNYEMYLMNGRKYRRKFIYGVQTINHMYICIHVYLYTYTTHVLNKYTCN